MQTLPDKVKNQLKDIPCSKEGFHVVDIEMEDGELYKNAVIGDGEDLIIPGNINVEGIKELVPTEGKPFPNEHACRLKSPSQFVRFRRQNNVGKVNGKRIDHIIGFRKDGSSDRQSVRYPKSVWKASSARSHCSGNKGKFEAAG